MGFIILFLFFGGALVLFALATQAKSKSSRRSKKGDGSSDGGYVYSSNAQDNDKHKANEGFSNDSSDNYHSSDSGSSNSSGDSGGGDGGGSGGE